MTDYYQIGPILAIWYHAYISPVEIGPGPWGYGPMFFPKGWSPGSRYIGPSTLHEHFIIGAGNYIDKAEWEELDEPWDFHPDNYIGFYEITVAGFRAEPPGHRIWALKVWLEFRFQLPPPPRYNTPPPRPLPPPAPIAPVAPNPFDLTEYDTYGRIIPYSAGARRLPGAKIWALDLAMGGDTIDTESATGTWADAFGYPLFPEEVFYLNRVWGNGQLIYADPAGPNSADTVQDGFDDLVFRVYYGTEDQLPDAAIVEDEGADRVPGFRGLIYIVFENVALSPFGNRFPQISAEFLREADDRILVSDVLERVGELGGSNVVCENITDEADGVVFDGMNPRGIIAAYINQYNYRIIDGDPIRLVRRLVGDDLVIDRDCVVDQDFVATGADDEVIALTRREDSELPNQFDMTFSERALDYMIGTQFARRPRFPVPATRSFQTTIERTDFIITAVEALTLAYDMLYRAWTRRLTAKFTALPHLSELEEGDVLRIPTPQGTFIFDITHRELQPNQTVALECDNMLAESGVEVTADSGFNTHHVVHSCYYPQILQPPTGGRIIAVDNQLWSHAACLDDTPIWYSISVIDTTGPIPSRISRANQIGYLTDVEGLIYGANADIVEEGEYVYAIGFAAAGYLIERIHKTTKVSEFMVVPYSDDLVANTLGVGSFDFTIFDGVLYFAFPGATKIGGFGPDFENPLILVKVPVEPWDEPDLAEFIELDVAPASNVYSNSPQAVVAVGSYVLVFTRYGFGAGQLEGAEPTSYWLYRYNTVGGGVSKQEVDVRLGYAVAVGDYAYFLPYSPLEGLIPTIGAKVHAHAFTVEYFDTVDDPGVFAVDFQQRPWADDTYLYFLANTVAFQDPDLIINQPYLGRRLLADLSQVDGFDLVQHFDNATYQVHWGDLDGDWHYLVGSARVGTVAHGNGCLLRVAVDGSSAVFHPFPPRYAPANDPFARPITLTLNTPKSFYNEWASKEVGEPDHGGDVGGKSLWYSFTAPTDGNYTVTVDPTLYTLVGIPGPIPQFVSYLAVAVYQGTSLENLVYVADGFGENHALPNNAISTASFQAAAGERYRIAIDGTFGLNPVTGAEVTTFGRSTITVTGTGTATDNDDFANAFVITAGQTKTGNNRFATEEPYEPDHDGNIGGKSLWWKFTAPNANQYRVSTNGSNFPTLLGVYTGED